MLTIKRIKLISLNSRMLFAEKVRPIVKKKKIITVTKTQHFIRLSHCNPAIAKKDRKKKCPLSFFPKFLPVSEF